MQNTFTRLLFLVIFTVIFSCARKEVYLLSNSGLPENTYVKKQNQALPKQNIQLPEQALPAPVPQPEPVVYTASTQPLLLLKVAALPEKVPFRNFLTTQPQVKLVAKLVKQQVKIIKAEKATLKNPDRKADTGKPRNKLAMVGFYLGLGAVLAFILAGVIGTGGAGILSLLGLLAAIGGLVTSKIGLSEINRNPEMYSGKGQALAGLIISITLLALLIIGVILLIAALRNFQ